MDKFPLFVTTMLLGLGQFAIYRFARDDAGWWMLALLLLSLVAYLLARWWWVRRVYLQKRKVQP